VPLSAVALAEHTQAVYFYLHISAQAHGQEAYGGVNSRTR
jgi:hypothetical protein